MTIRVEHGDCREVLAAIDADSLDACVTDPPYEIAFMGRGWDASGVAFDPETWRAVLRVLKPGAHMLAFGGTRTAHRMTCAIEDAGFEVRDTLCWLYGSGFPKSLDVSKAIDKVRVEDEAPTRVICRAIRAAMDARGLKSADLTEHFGGCHPRLIDHWAARDTDSQPSLPTWDQWETLRDLLALDADDLDREVSRLNERKRAPGDAWRSAEVVGEHTGETPGLVGRRFAVRDSLIRAPATPDADLWRGWGTALKPAHEPIILARKPFRGTVARNVLAYGTGGLNIDACRVEAGGARPAFNYFETGSKRGFDGGIKGGAQAGVTTLGRWPANVLHDGSDEVLAAFGFGDTGSAARFFYCAKADRADRADSKHPTVKPIDLLRWLVRMITPPGGTVLDPFAGSGTTGGAAMLEKFDALLIDADAQHVADIRHRIKRWSGLDAPLFAEPAP